ncbi:MAG TPA: YncE family protein [Candidatus Dormibacteraeota bacterium]|nr:YncE family protein [Candidatus Dormibacteraeota bacterium]
MKKIFTILFPMALMLTLAACQAPQQTAQTSSTTESSQPESRPLVLTETIPLRGIVGRFDHFGEGEGKLFVSALGDNHALVINTGGRVLDRSLPIEDPQGEAYSPDSKELFVASGKDGVHVFNGATFQQVALVPFEDGADDLRYDAANKRVYVGHGDEKTGGLAGIDAMTNKVVEDYKLGAEPENFQVETSGPNIYVNVPDLGEISVINRDTKAIAHWKLNSIANNFPMAMDEADHRIFIGTHDPARMAVFDTTSGKMVTALPGAIDTDDIFFDAALKRIYMPGGEGLIYVYQMTDPDHYQVLAKIPTTIGAKTAGFWGRQGKGFDRFYLAVPARGNESAEIRIYTVVK